MTRDLANGTDSNMIRQYPRQLISIHVPMALARLMAFASLRWFFAVTPVTSLGKIFPISETK